MGTLGLMPGVKISPGFNIGANYKVWPKTYFGGEFNYYSIGSQKKDTSGSTSFTSPIYELIAYGRFNLYDNKVLFKNDISKRPPRVRPYVSLGIGAVYYDPKVTVTDTNFFKKYKQAKNTNVTFVLPVSLGFAFYINKRFSVLTEFGYRYTLSDGLDGIKKISGAGKDAYMTASLKIQYTFHPLKKKQGKYVPPPEGYGVGGGSGGSKAKKDSTLNTPILPPGTPTDSLGNPLTPAKVDSATTPPAEAPKELTEEEKLKLENEREQKEWEESEKKKAEQKNPANKKKAVPAPAEKKQDNSGGW